MQHHSSEVEQVGSTCFSQCSWRCSISQTFVIRGNQWSSLVLHKEGSKRSFESCSPFSKRLKQERRWASKQMSQYFALAFSPENMALQVTLCWRARKFALQMPNCHNCHGSSLTSSLWDPAYKSCSFPPESNFNHQTDLKHPNLSDDLSHRLRYVVVMAFLAYLLVMDFTKIGPGQRLTRISLLIPLSFPGKVLRKDLHKSHKSRRHWSSLCGLSNHHFPTDPQSGEAVVIWDSVRTALLVLSMCHSCLFCSLTAWLLICQTIICCIDA